MRLRLLLILTGCLLGLTPVNSQPPQSDEQSIDGIAAIVDDDIILRSDLNQMVAMSAAQQRIDPRQNPAQFERLQRSVLKSLIDQKIMLRMAELDSVEVRDQEVDQALDQQLESYIAQVGSEKRVEETLGQPLRDFRREYWYDIRDQLISQRYQQTLLANISVTREEVSDFFNTYKDSLGTLPTQVKLRHILIPLDPSRESQEKALQLLDSLKTVIEQGADFAELAKQYSDDPGTASRGGDLGFVDRGTLVTEFETVAFTLNAGEISEPVKTDFGYHLIQTLEKKGEKIHVRHILIKPQITEADESRTYADAMALRDSISTRDEFKTMARKYSRDEQTSSLGGDLGWINPSAYHIPEIAEVIQYLSTGSCSRPVKSEYGYHLLWLEKVNPGGPPNLEHHWTAIESMALKHKKMQWFNAWIDDVQDKFYIKSSL